MSIVDVARIAEVSTATVSRVLNYPRSVRAETADRVHAAIQTLGYSVPKVRRGPKIGARTNSLATNQIAVITVDKSLRCFEQPAMGAILSGITGAARDAKLRILLEEITAADLSVPQFIQRRNIAGAILLTDSVRPRDALNHSPNHAPFVWISNGPSSSAIVGIEHVWTDDSAIGCLAYQQLRRKGCEQFVCLCDQPEHRSMRIRAQSFAHATAEEGKPVRFFLRRRDPLLLDSYGSHAMLGDNLEELVKLLAGEIAGDGRNGLFLPSDLLTAQVYPLLYQNKLKPGRDVTVATVANEQLRAAGLIPEPIGIDIGSEAIGRTAVERLLRRMQHPSETPKRTLVAPSVGDRG